MKTADSGEMTFMKAPTLPGFLDKLKAISWKILLFFLFLRPFISEYAFLSLGIIYIAYFTFFLILYLLLIRKKMPLSNSFNLLVFLFIIAIAVSIWFSGSTTWSLFELYCFMPNLLIFCFVSSVKPEEKKTILNTIFLAACIISVYAVYQYFIGLNNTLAQIKILGRFDYVEKVLLQRRVFATFMSPNIFASYIMMMLFLGIGYFITFGDKVRLAVGISLAILTMLAALLFTKSLGGIFAFFISLLLFICFVGFGVLRLKENKKTALNLNWFYLAVIFLSSAFLFFMRHRLFQFFDFSNPENSLVQRLYYWKASFGMIGDSFFTGIGWRKFGALYEFYKPFPANISHYSHNIFLQIMAEMGIFGALVFFFLVVVFLKKGFKAFRESACQRELKIGLFFAGVAFLVHNCIDISFYFSQAAFFWWVILGVFNES